MSQEINDLLGRIVQTDSDEEFSQLLSQRARLIREEAKDLGIAIEDEEE